MEKRITKGCQALVQFGCRKTYANIEDWVGTPVQVVSQCGCLIRNLMKNCEHNIWQVKPVDGSDDSYACIEECYLLRIDGDRDDGLWETDDVKQDIKELN